MAHLTEIKVTCACGRRAIKSLYNWRNELVQLVCAQHALPALRRLQDAEDRAEAAIAENEGKIRARIARAGGTEP
jgi:hypothetical protein